MSELFNSVVSEDSVEAWQELKSRMPWANEGPTFEWLKDLRFELFEDDYASGSKISLEGLPMYIEDYLDPEIVIGEDFYPSIDTCLSIRLLRGRDEGVESSVICIQMVAGDIYKSEIETDRELPFSVVSYLSVACPRCQLTFSDGEDSEEFDPEDEDWI